VAFIPRGSVITDNIRARLCNNTTTSLCLLIRLPKGFVTSSGESTMVGSIVGRPARKNEAIVDWQYDAIGSRAPVAAKKINWRGWRWIAPNITSHIPLTTSKACLPTRPSLLSVPDIQVVSSSASSWTISQQGSLMKSSSSHAR
jgi:hypothetical protein